MKDPLSTDPVVEAASTYAIHLEQTCQLQAAEVVRNLLRLCAELQRKNEVLNDDWSRNRTVWFP